MRIKKSKRVDKRRMNDMRKDVGHAVDLNGKNRLQPNVRAGTSVQMDAVRLPSRPRAYAMNHRGRRKLGRLSYAGCQKHGGR